MRVNLKRYGRIAVPHVFGDSLNRHVLRKEQAAICMSESVTGNVFQSPLLFELFEPLPDHAGCERFSVNIYGEIKIVELLFEVVESYLKPFVVLFQIFYQRVGQRDLSVKVLVFGSFS